MLAKTVPIILSTQPLPNLCKGCITRNFRHVELYVSRNFSKINSIIFLRHAQETLQKCASQHTVKRLRQVPVQNRIL